MSGAYKYTKTHREKKRAEGKCWDCSKPATEGKFCLYHKSERIAQNKRWRKDHPKTGGGKCTK